MIKDLVRHTKRLIVQVAVSYLSKRFSHRGNGRPGLNHAPLFLIAPAAELMR